MVKAFRLVALAVLVLSGTILSSTESNAADSNLMVHDAWIREAPPNMKMLAGYLTIMNHSAAAKSLVAVASDQFEKVKIHKTVHEAGVAKMIAQDSVEIGMHATVKFEPGGLHLMLINPKSQLKAGDKVGITLKFADGSEQQISANVKKGSAKQEHHHEHMHHDH